MGGIADLYNGLSEQAPQLIEWMSNGECKATLLKTTNQVDAQGFPNPGFDARTTQFIPCIWKIRTSADRDATERTIAEQVRGFLRYQITIPKTYDGAAVVISVSDQLQLKQVKGADVFVTLDVMAAVDMSGINWLVYAIDKDVKA